MKLFLISLSMAAIPSVSSLSLAQGVSGAGLAGQHGSLRAERLNRIWYVDQSATGNATGLSWQQAFVDLQDAMANASDGDQVWVAAGLYVPVPQGGVQTISFAIPSGVAVYGGFDGTENSLGQRDPLANTTTLSGDINRDDTYFPIFNITTANVMNVITLNNANAATRVDGFVVIGGHNSSSSGTGYGAGMLLTNSSAVIANCDFSYNVAAGGGAVSSSQGCPVIQNCSFTNNFSSAYSSYGGAVRNDGGTLLVMDSTFANNLAEGLGNGAYGGAVYSKTGSTFIERCSFTANDALPRIGGVFSLSNGGGVYVDSGFVRVSDSTFSSNCSNEGGAISSNLFAASTTEVHNSIFVANTAIPAILAGGLEGGGDAGAIYASAASTFDIVGCLLYGGSADNYGGAFVGGAGLISSSIFWNNSDAKGDIGISQVKADLVEYSCVMNMLVGEPGEDPPKRTDFPGSIALDPQFADELQGDYHLMPFSPCIDAGDNSAWPAFVTTDYEGSARFIDDTRVVDTGIGPAPVCDMGPLEKN